VKVTVTDQYSPPQVASDVSNVSFTIMAAPLPLSVSITSPDGGENWTVGSRHNITWTAAGGLAPLTVSLEYSTTGLAGPWSAVASGLANNGSRSWIVPDATSSDCYVRITVTDGDAPLVNATDTGNGSFTISPPGVPADTRAPLVRIVSPTASGASKGMVQVTLTATDDVGVTRLEILLDGVSLSSVPPAAPLFTWDTTKTSNGAHVLSARAYDAAGNMGVAAQVNLTVDNRKPAPPANEGFFEKNGLVLAIVGVLAVVAIVLGVMMMRRRPPVHAPQEEQRVQATPQPLYPQPPPPAVSPPGQLYQPPPQTPPGTYSPPPPPPPQAP
jgi:hypothetical protein